MNALICIGCDRYDHLPALTGAEKDATEIFAVLTQKNEYYSKEVSHLLLSPDAKQILDALNKSFPQGRDVDVLTFFFAGHAGVKMGTFFLCARKSDSERLSTTSFPIVSLFSIINEFHPRQVNIVIDACGAGGASLDLSQLLKSEVIGHSESTSIAFLGACTADQYAGETSLGGILTQELLKCLTGEKEVQSKSEFLDLIEVGGVVCQDVLKYYREQKPISWGLSLFGNGRFAKNPHFNLDPGQKNFPVPEILPTSPMGQKIRAKSGALWEEYRKMKEDFSPRRLLDLLNTIFLGAEGNAEEMVISLQGLSRTMSSRARESTELLAPSQCLATCIVPLLPYIDSAVVRDCAVVLLREIISADTQVWKELLQQVETNKYALLNRGGVMADLYYLPMRISKLLGWIGWAIVAKAQIPELDDGNDEIRFRLASSLIDHYEDSLVSVSDEQAPYLYVFLKACLINGENALAERAMTRYFASFAERMGNVNRAGGDGVQAYRYILSLGPKELQPNDWRPANPSYLLAVLLLAGSNLDKGAEWSLRAIDRAFSAFFIPENYRDFGRKIIERGMNYTQQIGFNLWQLKHFKTEFARALKVGLPAETEKLSTEGKIICVLSSLLFPDRVAFLLENPSTYS